MHPVSDASAPGQIRRAVVGLANSLGFATPDAGRVGLAATEAATNIVKHAGRGQVLFRAASDLADRPGIELLAIDQGPGMTDLARCMQDGFSTAGSPGTGLGALSRLASELDIYTLPKRGTALLVRIVPQSAKRVGPAPFAVGAVRVAKPGESVCGDAWSVALGDAVARFVVADGLGHGPAAEAAALAAVRAFDRSAHEDLSEVFRAMHGSLLATRGAAVSIAEIATAREEVRFAGLGNVAGFLAWPGDSRHMLSQNGTLGVQLGHVRVESHPWRQRAVLVLHSDGLNTHASLDAYPGLLAHHPSLVAAVLYRDFVRGTDDATVLVAKAT